MWSWVVGWMKQHAFVLDLVIILVIDVLH